MEISSPQTILFTIGTVLFFALIALIILRIASRSSIPGPSLTSDDGGHFEVLGKRVICLHCKRDVFKAREILLNTWLLSLLSLEWLDPGSTVLICQECGRLTWFSQKDVSEQKGTE